MLNKKVLVAAVIGGLFAGNAAATDFTATTAAAYNASIGVFAKEIKTTATAATAAQFDGVGVDVKWESGYAYSPGEVRYVRIEAAPHVKFQAATAVTTAAGTSGALTAGAINGVGSNVITFSVTADAVDGATADAVFTLDAVVKLLAIADSDIKVSLYDQPSQAQAGGTTGLITGGSVEGDYIKFANSLKWVNAAETAVADVEANPSFTLFTAATANATVPANTGADLNSGLGIALVGTRKADSSSITIADLLDTAPGKSNVTITGDFSFVASSGATPFDAAARGRLVAFGGSPAAAGDLTASTAVFGLAANAVGGSVFSVKKAAPTASWNTTIAASTYTAKLNAVAVTPAVYNVPVLGDAVVGEIERNGTELQAPLAQIPGGWYSRLVLTNTSGVARPYTISVMTEAGVTVTTGNLTGTIPANGTKVIDDLSTVFSGNNRATLNVSVAGPDKSIQGLYQIVNPTSGSVSNHVLVRPGTN
ncbi:hypothetical protein [Stenotrophomonas acidaminiphila]|uniref:hypothetical protein n=1 Tax=Stenotrophomonas acidaminiphila TaxID=128780 RepID=UPI0028B10DFD|nr:hypothetical protein [Stenotrophomonas acidaminiphila]